MWLGLSYSPWLDDLIAKLDIARKEFAQGQSLEAATAALIAVHDFLEREPAIRQRGLAEPLRVLAHALANKVNGTDHPLLQISPPRKRRPSEDTLKGFVLHATDILHQRGVKFPVADDLVSKALAKRRITFKAASITQLRAEVGRGGGRTRPSETVTDVRKLLTDDFNRHGLPAASPKEIAEALTGGFLAQLGDTVGPRLKARGRVKEA